MYYNQEMFRAYNPEKGDFLWESRNVLEDCVNAMIDGTIVNWFPKKSFSEEGIIYRVKIMDYEWLKEGQDRGWKGEGPGLNGLTIEQKACLVEKVDLALSGKLRRTQ